MSTTPSTPAPTESGGRLRVGVVGLGWAGEQHLNAYAARDDVEVVGMAGLEADRLAALQEQHGFRIAVADWRELVASGEIDAVSVAVPTFLHAPISIGALDAGLHVLSEKPMARDAREADEMVAAARRAGRVLQVAFNYRHRGDISSLAEEVGELGRVYHARGSWMRRSGIPTLGSWFTNREMAGGGPLIDLGVHVLDALLWLSGEPKVVSASAVTHAELGPRGLGGSGGGKSGGGSAYEVEDLATALLRLEDGGSIALETSWATHRPDGDEFALTLYGTEGGAAIRVVDYAPETDVEIFAGPGGTAEVTGPDGVTDRVLPGRAGTGHQGVIDEFVAAVADPSSWARHDGAVAAERARVIEACYLSAQRGTEVALSELTTAKENR
jgi:predicted dehydrogenase